ncbi:MAG: SCO family protein [Rhodospirillales bacterium]|nr:SCO family protein [Rhodospirillales bacterium]
MKTLLPAVLALLLTAWAPAHGTQRGPFALTDHHGKAVTDRDYLGSYMLVFFGYTHCPDVCPMDLQIISRAMDLLGEKAARVRPLFISVDPARDTPKVMADYVGHFHPRLVGLTGTADQVARAARVYRIQYRKFFPAPDGGEDTDNKTDYLMDHSTATILIGPDGAPVGLYPHGMNAKDMAKDLLSVMKAAKP